MSSGVVVVRGFVPVVGGALLMVDALVCFWLHFRWVSTSHNSAGS